jgi:iron complex outermembrane receptor protein/vitamin B12 transporter
VVSGAGVKLLRDAAQTAQTTTDARGEFAFQSVAEGRYQIEVTAAGFEVRRTDPTFVGSPVLRITLQIGPLQQDVVVSAAATEQPESQVGSSVTVINAETLQQLGKTDVLEALRLVPGTHIVQIGARGGPTSLFIRGGNSNFNKVLIDGVPANDVGGAFDFAQLTTTGVESVEVLRTANSVLYGSDALSGVVSIITKRGRSRIPDATFSLDGGNLNTFRQVASAGGAVRRFDYFSELSHLGTDNDVPNNKYRNTTYVGRFGAFAGTNTDISGTVRWTDTKYGSPNAFSYYGIADDAVQDNSLWSATIWANSQINNRVRTTVRFGSAGQTLDFVDPAPTGEPSDPFGFGPNYLGNQVTIAGANGYTTSGRAIMTFGGSTYPSASQSSADRQLVSGQVDYQVSPSFEVSSGGRYEHENGASTFGNPPEITRNNGGAFVEGRVSAGNRVSLTGGVGVEHNAIFGNVATPRVSVAVFAHNASGTSNVGESKLTFNAGKGIKSPSLFQEQSSLFAIIPAGSPLSGNVSPVGPERSRGFDAGIEQGFWRGRARARVAYFRNEFFDLLEFVDKNVLPQLGVPVDVANATQFGASVNSQSFDAQGVETSGEVAFARVKVVGSYTFLDAEVQESLGGGALSPAFNPAFPDVPIGAFSPLIGALPFRRPANSGTLMVSYTQGPAQVALSGHFVGKQDDSTFLTDEFFGNSLLLPNHNLDDSFQKVDLSGSYVFARRIRWYITLENLLNQKYQAAAGYPALPTTVRTGVTLQLGGGATP